jgi:hypothetical protein
MVEGESGSLAISHPATDLLQAVETAADPA